MQIKAIKHLNEIAESHSNYKYLIKPNLKREDYFNDQSMSRSDVELLFSLRTHMIDVKKNFSSKYNNSIGCHLCLVYVEDQKHLMNCEKLTLRVNVPVNVEYDDIFKSVEKQREVVHVYKELLRVCEIFLNTTQ